MRRYCLLPATFLLALFPFALAVRADDPEKSDVPELKENIALFMRAKLTHSQKVLEGLATENFDEIAKSSQEMSLISQAAQWQVIQTPEYARRSAEFRREVDALTKAGKDKNIDGATLSYLKVTMNCIECHKYVRSVREASLQDDGLSLQAPRFQQLEVSTWPVSTPTK